MKELAIIMLNWNGHEDTIECIKSIRSNEDYHYTIFILDNGSKKESIDYIKTWMENNYKSNYFISDYNQFKYKRDFNEADMYIIENDQNFGFAKGNNIIWDKIKGEYDYVLLLNNDTVIEKNAITKMLEYMKSNSSVGAVSCDIRLYSDRNILWNAGGYFTWYGDRKYFTQNEIDNYKRKGINVISTPFITGCALMVRKSVSESIGIFTEKFFFGEEDFNYCKRLQKSGIKVETVLDSTIYHKVSNSINKSNTKINKLILHFSNRIINQKEFLSPYKVDMLEKNVYASYFSQGINYE